MHAVTGVFQKLVGYGGGAAQWAGKLGADPTLNAKFMKLLTGG